MSIFDHSSTMPGYDEEQESEIETREVSEKEPAEEVVPEAGEEKAEGLSGESVKVPAILKPRHMEWLKEQDFGLSEWVRDGIDEEIEGESGAEPAEEKESDEGADSASETCEVCGKDGAMQEIRKDGEVKNLCKDCLEENVGEPSREKNGQGDDSNSDSSEHTCEMCEMSEAVKQVPMGSGRSKMWLCETCMQEEGFRQARRQ